MLSVDSNILLYAFDSLCKEHEVARRFLRDHESDPDFAVCELVLVELYVLLRNPVVVSHPLTARDAVEVVHTYRSNRHWSVIEGADGVMQEVWAMAGGDSFARRRIFDARLAVTLRRRGVQSLATRNVAHFQSFGFDRVWDPLA